MRGIEKLRLGGTTMTTTINKQDGFSLLEVLIALVILAIGLLAIAQMQIAAIKGNAMAADMTEASTVAHQLLEQLKAQNNRNIAANSNSRDRYNLASGGAPYTQTSANPPVSLNYTDPIRNVVYAVTYCVEILANPANSNPDVCLAGAAGTSYNADWGRRVATATVTWTDKNGRARLVRIPAQF
ncbi:MAG: type IV pilus modification protein PilV [Thermodesulfovibrionia bacterium]|nr:type IV pilus modification protein PilV [Thermodesulfovibrionia bacterium]